MHTIKKIRVKKYRYEIRPTAMVYGMTHKIYDTRIDDIVCYCTNYENAVRVNRLLNKEMNKNVKRKTSFK